jgi:hypothetical protein
MRFDDAPMPLAGLLARADSVEHAVATFDEVDGGLARLQAAGFVTVDAGLISLTAAGRELVRAAGATSMPINKWQSALERALGATPWTPDYRPEHARRDPTLPARVTRAEYEAAVRSNDYRRS